MLFISKQGHVDAERIEVRIFPAIERGPMNKVNGIVVHQTNGSNSQSTFNSYMAKGANGAHFLIDKDGKIYQTASLYKTTNHVGLLKSRCIERKVCSPSELQKISRTSGAKRKSNHEISKSWPDRYPWNSDSIGIELVGKASGPKDKEVYENTTENQNTSLRRLINEPKDTLGVSMQEIYRHPDISYKNLTEAKTAQW